jgi:hypothetical protein
MAAHARAAVAATFHREIAASLLSRFLQVHLALAAAIGLLPLFTPQEAAAAVPLWVLGGVSYGLALSAVLFGLSAAHADADEFPLLFTQPAPRWAWLLGKVAALAAMLIPAAVVLVVPTAWRAGPTGSLAGLAAAAAGVTLALSILGLAIGLLIRDRVRGLLVGLAVWFALVFGSDLLLLAASGAPWVSRHPDVWVGLLMANPLDALRIAILFGVERTAFASLDVDGLIRWWLDHAWMWLALLVAIWTMAAFGAGLAGARRRRDA